MEPFSLEFAGRLHPLIVHLPIGILLFAFALILFQRARRMEIESVISFALLSGAVSAAAACVAGWILAQSGEYDAGLVFKHQWTGIATAGFGFVSYFVKRIRGILSAITVCILVAAGHFGGSLTHGEDYLLPQKKTAAVKTGQVADSVQSMAAPQMRSLSGTSEAAAPDAKIASKTATQTAAQKIFVYRDLVTPILKKKCYSCHSASKMKGGLRLDSEAFIKKGSKNGSIYTPGNPEKSILFSNLLLPDDDDLHMPPKGKPQLTTQEIATIHFWIKKGASFGAFVEATAAGTSNPASIARLSKTLTNEDAETDDLKPENTGRGRLQNIEAKILENKTEAAPPDALTKLTQQDIIISNLGEGSNYLIANFVNVKNYRSALIDDLSSVDDQLISVKLSGQPVTDDDVKKLSLLKNLVRLNLEKTAITDAALAHLKNLPNLQYLNLYGTIVTDKGLSALAKCPNLKVVYLWQTKTTPAGVRQLRKSLPNIRVESGDFQFAKRDTSKI